MSETTSTAKIDANRANARKSTGPRSDEGKMKAAQNAWRHGLTSKHLCVPANRQSEFDGMKAGYEIEIQPVGQIQQDLFDQLIHAAWNLRIVRELLAQALQQNEATTADRLLRYLNQHERSYHRALKALRTVQTDRAIRCLPEHQHLENLPDTVNPVPVLRELAASAKRTRSPITFAPPPDPDAPASAAANETKPTSPPLAA